MEMKRRLTCAVAFALAALGLTSAVAVAVTADAPTVVRAGNLVLTVDGGITPRALPPRERVPIGFDASGDLATVDGTHPPAVRHGSFEIDRDVAIDVAGLPVCPKGRLVARSSADALAACPGALLGRGRATVEVAFPEQAPLEANGPLLLFNGGERGGVITFYVHTYVSIPAPTAVVITGQARRIHHGSFGLRIDTTVPPIAGGAGSLTHFELNASRYVKGTSPPRGFVSARCSDGRIVARGIIGFSDDSELAGEVVRSCEKAG
jgi:hypothetical protein